METNISTRSIPLESKEKSLALPGKVVESLLLPSCDPKEIVLQLKENLPFDQRDLKQPTPETTRMIRCLVAKAKDTNRIDVVNHLREITPAGTTGELACSVRSSVVIDSSINEYQEQCNLTVMFTATAQHHSFS